MPPDSDFPLDAPERGDYSLPRVINNAGQVGGYYLDAGEKWHGFLATPFPDYNANGVVDAADFTVWRDTLGSTTDMRANGDNSGASYSVIDWADYAIWKAHFGETADSGLGATPAACADVGIPEPAALALVMLAAVLCAGLHPCCARVSRPRTLR